MVVGLTCVPGTSSLLLKASVGSSLITVSEVGAAWTFDSDWVERVARGPWVITDWPMGFPDELKQATIDAVNDNIPHGCCGGCV